ncbi:MAG TPA: hypothetical protein VFS76_02260 [Pyrinomonadaceae bacterium]|nr:hypothetical protein [Pyrinomonadaceae bacterium]
MSWHDAPVLRKLTACQQGGSHGAQLWGVDIKGTLFTTYQKTPGGVWSDWMSSGWTEKNYPKQVYELAAAQRYDGGVQLWVLDMKRQIWTTWQNGPGGDWHQWQGPGWNNMPSHLRLKKISATQLAGAHGAQLWGIAEDGTLVGCYQIVPSGAFSPWQNWATTPEDSRWLEVSACKQGNGLGALWGIDEKQQLWCMFQKVKGGEWGTWQGPNWNKAPKVRNVAAVELGGQKGGCVWIITNEYKFYQSTQSAPGGNEWWAWSPGDYKESLFGYEITAAGQNNGLAQVWGVSLKQDLHSQVVNKDSKDWEWYWTPPA